MIKSNSNIKGGNNFNHNYLCILHMQMTQHFFKQSSINYGANENFQIIPKIFCLKPNILKCEVACIGSLKGVKMTVCAIKCIHLTIEAITNLGVHFSYNQKLKTQKIFVKSITNMQMF